MLEYGSRVGVISVRIQEHAEEKRESRIERARLRLQRHLLHGGVEETFLDLVGYILASRELRGPLCQLLARLLGTIRAVGNRLLEVFEILLKPSLLRSKRREESAVGLKRRGIHVPCGSPHEYDGAHGRDHDR